MTLGRTVHYRVLRVASASSYPLISFHWKYRQREKLGNSMVSLYIVNNSVFGV